MTDSKMQWFGVALQDDGKVIVTKGRATEEAAAKLAAQRDGVEHFAVQAANAGEAKKAAAERALQEAAKEVGGLGEPSAQDIAAAVASKADVPRGVKGIGSTRWYGATLTGGGEDKKSARVTEVGHRTIDEAIAEAKSVRFGKPFAIQAIDPESALLVADALHGQHDGEPIFATPTGSSARSRSGSSKKLATAKEEGRIHHFPVGLDPKTKEWKVDPGVGYAFPAPAGKRAVRLEDEGFFKAGSGQVVAAWDADEALKLASAPAPANA